MLFFKKPCPTLMVTLRVCFSFPFSLLSGVETPVFNIPARPQHGLLSNKNARIVKFCNVERQDSILSKVASKYLHKNHLVFVLQKENQKS